MARPPTRAVPYPTRGARTAAWRLRLSAPAFCAAVRPPPRPPLRPRPRPRLADVLPLIVVALAPCIVDANSAIWSRFNPAWPGRALGWFKHQCRSTVHHHDMYLLGHGQNELSGLLAHSVAVLQNGIPLSSLARGVDSTDSVHALEPGREARHDDQRLQRSRVNTTCVLCHTHSHAGWSSRCCNRREETAKQEWRNRTEQRLRTERQMVPPCGL